MGLNGKGKAHEEYGADEALYRHRGDYSEVATVNGGRNPWGAGDDPNDERSLINGNRRDRGGWNNKNLSGGRNQEAAQQLRGYMGRDMTNDTSIDLILVGRATPAPTWNSGSAYSWACVSD